MKPLAAYDNGDGAVTVQSNPNELKNAKTNDAQSMPWQQCLVMPVVCPGG